MNNIICPWCHAITINAKIFGNHLRIKCSNCGMDAYIIKLPKNVEIADILEENLHHQKEFVNARV